MNKECIVVMLPTKDENPTSVPFVRMPQKDKLVQHVAGGEFRKYIQLGFKPQHLYICSTDEIKEGDWCVFHDIARENRKDYSKSLVAQAKLADSFSENKMKIIATTCNSLKIDVRGPVRNIWQASLSSIPQSFIKEYVEAYNAGKPIEKVMVEYETKLTSEDGRLKMTTNFEEKIPVTLGKELHKHSFSGEYIPKFNGNEIIISVGKEPEISFKVMGNKQYNLYKDGTWKLIQN